MTSLHKPASVRLPLQTAHQILLAKTLEESADEKVWPVDAARRASLAALRELGENPSPARFLAARAERVCAAFTESESIETNKPFRAVQTAQRNRFPIPKLHGSGITLLLALLAYLFGAFADRWSADGRIINLLSPPILGILAWNLVVYAALILSWIRRLFKKQNAGEARSARALIEGVIRKSASLKLTRTGRKFAGEMLLLLEPAVRAMAARAFHLAAAAFAAGLLASIAVRGIGTAYVVGWESTWFADNPNRIAGIFEILYGWLSVFVPSAPDISAAGVAAMNLAAGGAAPDPSPWLLALMGLLCAVVILPRLALSGLLTWQIARNSRSVLLPLNNPYYDAIFEAASPARPNAVLYIDASIGDSRLETLLTRLRGEAPSATVLSALTDAECIPCSIWEDEPTKRFGNVSGKPVFLWLDAAATPEAEVHGAALKAIAAAAAPEKASLILDLAALSQRFGPSADNVKMRRTLWTRFAEDFGIETIVLGGTSQTHSSADPS